MTDGTSGGVLPGIAIALSSGAAAMTDAGGRYAFDRVPIGALTIAASAVSYITAMRSVTLSADTTVDLVLQRAAAPTPSPTPFPPTPAHGGIRSDTIAVGHELIVGSPVPTSSQNTVYCCWPWPLLYQGSFDYELSRYPLDLLPSGGNTNTISASEMLFAGIRFAQPATQPTTFTWHRAILGIDAVFATDRDASPARTGAFGYVGHFSWEITAPGLYYVVIETEWGSMTIDFVVR